MGLLRFLDSLGFGRDVSDNNPLPVKVKSGDILIDGPITISNEVEVKNDSGNPIPVAGSSAAGSAPTAPPLSVSGVDSGGLKRHLKTDPDGNQGIYGAAARSTATATIANGASVSGSIDLTATSLLGFIMPAAWTAAALNIEVSADNSRWITAGAYTSDGSLATSFSVAADTAYAVDTLALLPFRYIRFRSGTSASPVNQVAARNITVITRPLA